MSAKNKSKQKSEKKHEVNEKRADAIKEKLYVSEEIETSITLLASPEDRLVLEALLFLSKYADIQENNLVYIQANGVMPKLLALFEHNICILRVSLRLVSQLLAVEAARIELNKEIFDEAVMKICGFFVGHKDVCVKEFSSCILAVYCTMEKSAMLLNENNFLAAVLRSIREPENQVILLKALELLYKYIEFESVRTDLPQVDYFSMATFYQKMNDNECTQIILNLFEKLTYFSDDALQIIFKENTLVELLFNIITDPEQSQYISIALRTIKHCMRNEITNNYFVISFEFLKFSEWVKTCPDEAITLCSDIFLNLSKMDTIRQLLFDLNIEETILSFLRSDDKIVLTNTCEAISSMSKHKFCCEKMLTPIVIKKILSILNHIDPFNETAVLTLYYFCRRECRTIHMISCYDGLEILFKYLQNGIDKLSPITYSKLLEILNMFVINSQLCRLVLSPLLYDVILTQTSSQSNEICMRCLEIMINCLSHKDFQNYFIANNGVRVLSEKLTLTDDQEIVRLLIIFIYKALVFDTLATDLIYNKILLVLKKVPEYFVLKIPLIDRVINAIYDCCLPFKFHETGRLELTDKLSDKFYIITGTWRGTFPFLEILSLQRISTKNTIYVILNMDLHADTETVSTAACLQISDGRTIEDSLKRCISYGALSPDPYLPKYYAAVAKLLHGVKQIERKLQIVAKFVDEKLCGPEKKSNDSDKLHTFSFHLECLKQKLGTNMIPVGYLRMGFCCERALLFKAICDYVGVPVTLVRDKDKRFWNEVGLLQRTNRETVLKMHVVDLMNNIGQLLPLGSRECNKYCDVVQ